VKRLTIYAFYDPEGLVDDYVVDCVVALSEQSEKVLVVSNGKLEAASLSRLTEIPSTQVVQRSNKGFDIWGYKYGLDFVGWSELERYDEVVLTNSTIAGPLYPLSEMFDAMDARDVDFWGLTMHGGEDYDPWHLLPTGRIEPHIQSFFTAFRPRMLQSTEFREYWQSLPAIRSYTEAVALHEAVFTHRFAELGFRWTTYVHGTDLECLSSYPLMFLPEQVLIGKRCPFFKRKALFLEAADLIATQAASTVTMLECLDRLGYDLQRVLPNVIRTNHQSDIRLSMNAFELLASRPDQSTTDSTTDLSKVRVVAWVRGMADCLALERCRQTLERCLEFVIVTANDPESELAQRLSDFRARIVSGSTFAEFVREVGCASRTKAHVLLFGANGGPPARHEISTYVQSETGLRALADNDATLTSAVRRLENSTLAGALTSPLTGLTPTAQAAIWRTVASRTEKLLKALGVHVPIHPEKPAWGPPSGVVLAGPNMLAADWDLAAGMMSDLSDETAGALLASLIPFIVQSHGRLLAFALPDKLAGMSIFSAHVQALPAPAQRTLRTLLRTQAARSYRSLRRRLRERAASRQVSRAGLDRATDEPGRV